MDQVLAQLIAGLAYASTLFLVSAGLTLVFGVTRVVNFAHGSFYMLGAYLALTLTAALPSTPVGFFGGLLLAAVAAAAIGALVELLVLRRIYQAPELLQLLATFGVVLIVQDATLAIWGPEEQLGPRAPGLRGSIELGATRVPQYTVFLLAAGPVVFAALWWLVRRTRWGLDLRAAAQDGEMASALGVNRRLLFTTVFALGAGLAGLAGALQLPRESVNLQMDLAIVVEAFVVVVVGGLGSIGGAAAASVLIGVLHAFGVWWLPQSTLVLMFVAMAVVLVWRPHGLLGRPLTDGAARVAAHAPFVPADRRLRVAWTLAAALALTLPWWSRLFAGGEFLIVVATDIAVLTIFAASLHLMMGSGGITSFGHAAFFGAGAYSAALLAKYLDVGLGGALVAGPLLALLLALAAGVFVLRAQGVYAAMLTLALAQVLWSVATQWVAVTGGDNGVLGLWPPGALAAKAVYCTFAVTLALATLWLLRRVALSPYGFALRAVRDARARAEASGVSAFALQWGAFAAGGLFAGLAGVLNSYHKGAVFPQVLAISQSVDALLMLLLGGIATLSGPAVGAAAYHVLAVELTRATEYWRALLGLTIVLLVVAFPQGIAGVLRARLERRP